MKTLCLFILILFSQGVLATWTDLNTDIPDELTGVVFWGNLGMVSGHHGLYYTSTGGSGPTSWQRFEITGNSVDSLRYNQSKFYHCSSDPINGTNLVFACGQDTVSGRAIIMSVDLSTLTYSMIYEGPLNSLLRHIDFSASYSTYYASGNDGLLVKFTPVTSPSVVLTGYSNDFYGVGFYGSKCWIAAEDTVLAGSHNNSNFSVYDYPTPGDKHYGVTIRNNSYGYSAGNAYHRFTLASQQQLTSNNNFDFGPLNGQCIISKGNTHYIGTDHGIFQSGGLYQYLEWQPSSQQHSIHDFWYEGFNGTDFYACGSNGIVLKSNNNGGGTKPYATINASGGCVGSTKTISGIVGSSNNCNWYINGTLEHTLCGSFTQQFLTAGTYQIELFVTNAAGFSDTASHTIFIVNYPMTNLPTTLTDSILCKTSPAEITISQSEPDVYYTLRKVGSFPYVSYGNSPPGNGGALTYLTSPLHTSGTYALLANSTLAPCSAAFSDQMSITVEQTKAAFHSGTINAELGEVLTLFETTRDAQSFQWTFGPSASISSSTLAEPSLSFSQLGQDSVQLIASSLNGCHDTLTAPGPFIYQASMPSDSCWTLVNKGEDPTWSGIYYRDIACMIPVEDGFLTSGYFDSTVFASQQGASYVDPVKSGGYLAKYSYEGVIKWFTYSKQTDPTERENVNYIASDSSGNIYITGNTEGSFFDNARDSVLVASSFLYKSYLNKLSPQGELIWTLKSRNLIPKSIAVGPDQNVLVTCNRNGPSNPSELVLNINGIDTDTIDATPYNGLLLLKLSPNGEVIWHTGISIGEPIITFDSANHFYISGNFTSSAEMYSVGSSTPVTVPYNGRSRLLLTQYTLDSGQLQWLINSETTGGVGFAPTQINDMVTDSAGYCYLSGSNDCSYSGYQHVFHNSDSSTTSTNKGEYFIAKINPQGICEWIRGAGNTYYGYGFQIFKRDNLITSIGRFSQNSGAYETASFSSSSGDSLTITLGRSDYFAAQYDTDGNLLSVALNGDNGASLYVDEYYGGFFQSDDGSYYSARNIGFFLNSNNYDNFGTVIDTALGVDGTITRFYPDCGILYTVCSENPAQLSLTESACGSYSSPSGMILTQSGLYQDTVFSSTGCDSVFTIDLSIEQNSAFSLTDTACEMYMSPSGAIFTNSGIYIDTLSNTAGCDSLITIDLTVNTPDSVSEQISSCGDYLSSSGQVWTSSGTYIETYTNSQGCDSLVTTFLTIDSLDLSIVALDSSLMANDTSTMYQWVDCSLGYQWIAGETAQSFEPNLSGSYAVILTQGTCIDTSDCMQFVLTSATETALSGFSVQILPNPNSGSFTLQLHKQQHEIQVNICDIQGKQVFQETYYDRQKQLIGTELPSGIYFVQVSVEQQKQTLKLIVY